MKEEIEEMAVDLLRKNEELKKKDDKIHKQLDQIKLINVEFMKISQQFKLQKDDKSDDDRIGDLEDNVEKLKLEIEFKNEIIKELSGGKPPEEEKVNQQMNDFLSLRQTSENKKEKNEDSNSYATE